MCFDLFGHIDGAYYDCNSMNACVDQDILPHSSSCLNDTAAYNYHHSLLCMRWDRPRANLLPQKIPYGNHSTFDYSILHPEVILDNPLYQREQQEEIYCGDNHVTTSSFKVGLSSPTSMYSLNNFDAISLPPTFEEGLQDFFSSPPYFVSHRSESLEHTNNLGLEKQDDISNRRQLYLQQQYQQRSDPAAANAEIHHAGHTEERFVQGGHDELTPIQPPRRTSNASNTRNKLTAKIAARKRNTRKRITIAQLQCLECFKIFSRPYNLKSHEKTHTKDKPYVCSHPGCKWSFARPHDLKRHDLLHTGIKPFSCDYCGRRFSRSDAFKRHQAIDNLCIIKKVCGNR